MTRVRVPTWVAQSVIGVLLVAGLNLLVSAPESFAQQTPAATCAANNGGCAAGMTCFDGPASVFCGYCPSGYTTNGKRCEDVNECATDNGGCGAGVQCANVPGGWRCGANCPPGFRGTPQTGCVDVNECGTNNGACDVLSTCRNTPGSRTCGPCPEDHVGDGYVGCFDVNETTTGQDKRSPALMAPSSMTVAATSTEGTPLTFTVTARDFVDGARPVTCDPASGFTFPVGTTTVTCTATDNRGNKGVANFSVTVVAAR